MTRQFEFKKLNDYSETYAAYLLYDDDDPDAKNYSSQGRYLGDIIQRNGGHWKIDKIGVYNEIWKESTACLSSIFDSKEQTAAVMLFVIETVNQNPLPTDIRAYLEASAREFQERKSGLLRELYSVNFQLKTLQRLAKQYNIEYEFDVDTTKEAQDILDFMKQYNDQIYEHFGKDWARSLRGLVASLVRTVDPEVAFKI